MDIMPAVYQNTIADDMT